MNFDSNLWGEADENDNLTQALFGPVSFENKKAKKKSKNVSPNDLERESKTSKEFLKNIKALERKHHVVRFDLSDEDEDGDDLRKRTKMNMKERKRKKRQKTELRIQQRNEKKKKNLDSDEEMFAEIDDDDPISETVAKKPKLLTTPSKVQENVTSTVSKRKQKALKKEQKLEKKRKREEEEEEKAKINLENSNCIEKRKDSPFVVNTKGFSKKKKLQIDGKVHNKKKEKSKERFNIGGNGKGSENRNVQAKEGKSSKSGDVGNSDKIVKDKNKNLNNGKNKNKAVEIQGNGHVELKSNNSEKKGKSMKNELKENNRNETNTLKISKSSPKIETCKQEKKLPRTESKTKKTLKEKEIKKNIDVVMENIDKPMAEDKPGKKKKIKPKVVVEQDSEMFMEGKKIQKISKKERVIVVKESSNKVSADKTPIPKIHNKNVNSKLIFNKRRLSDILSKKSNVSPADNQSIRSSKIQRQGEKSETPKLSSLRERMSEQLNEARFRYLNEQLYTQSGPQAFKMFQNDQEAFKVYHKGFQSQVAKWPVNPVDVIIKQVRAMPKTHLIADFGCGIAKLAQSVKNKVHSFDLVQMNDLVTVCDISKVPLANKTVDVVVICLSLMGTNLNDFIMEANRILKIEGILKIAEVESRVTNTQEFISQIESFGFSLLKKDVSNKMFHMFDFKKLKPAIKSTIKNVELAPCLYKKR